MVEDNVSEKVSEVAFMISSMKVVKLSFPIINLSGSMENGTRKHDVNYKRFFRQYMYQLITYHLLS